MIQNENNKSNQLKSFSSEVFNFIQSHKQDGLLLEGNLKYFSSKRLIVISNVKIDTLSAIDYIVGCDNIYILQYANYDDTYRAYIHYVQDPSIISVEPDMVIELDKPQLPKQPKLSLHESELIHSWGFEYIKSQEAFDYILQNKTVDGLPQIVVGVIDDGVETGNPIFKTRLLNAYSFVGESPNPYKSDMGHGAKVCSVLMENTSENVKIISYKIFSERETTLSILRLAEMQAELDGVDFINSSYGMFVKFESRLHKALHIASAGNVKCNTPQYPAACDGVISVGGITPNGVLSDTSTYGDWVTVAAPSENIKLPSIYGLNEYIDFSGTSCAAPFVTAICAMIKTQHPNLNNKQIKQVLYNSCDTADVPVKYGIVNMFNAVSYLDNMTQTKAAGQIVDFTPKDIEPALV